MNLDFRIILKKIFFIFTNRSLKGIAYSASISEKVILKKVRRITGLPTILIIGDSISIGYTEPLRYFLKNVCVVQRPPLNCRDIKFVVENFSKWTKNQTFDLICFNVGLHDVTKKRSKSEKDYIYNLKDILNQATSKSKKIVFITLTPSPVKTIEKKISKLNKISKKLMSDKKIPIIDLHKFTQPLIKRIQYQPNDIHYNGLGYWMMGEFIAKRIKVILYKLKN